MKIVWGWVALTGFVLSLAVHLLTAFRIDFDDLRRVAFTLFVGIFVVFVPVVHEMRRSSTGFFALLRSFAPWPRAILVAVLAYAIVNFGIGFIASLDGHPERRGDHLVLEEDGRFVREIGMEEFRSRQGDQIRMLTGHCLVFYSISFAVLVLRKPYRRTAGSSRAPFHHGR